MKCQVGKVSAAGKDPTICRAGTGELFDVLSATRELRQHNDREIRGRGCSTGRREELWEMGHVGK